MKINKQLATKAILGTLLSSMCTGDLCAQANPVTKLTEAYKTISQNYVDEIDDQKLVDAAINGMMSVLDPHSKYFNSSDAETYDNKMAGKFYGVGVQYLMENDSVYITEIIPDGPADGAGLVAGDIITKIDSVEVSGAHKTNFDIYNLLRGEKEQPVVLSVKRNESSQPLIITLKRGVIPDHSVTAAYMVDKSIGYISLAIFNRNTRTEIDKALDTLVKQGMTSLILDLQDNGGGYVESAIGVVDELLDGKKMVFYSVPRDGGHDYYYTAGSGKFMQGNLVVLINQSTASASEITTGALQDWDRGVIVGRRSFGKGLTQKAYALIDGSTLDLTNTRYHAPTGRSFQKSYSKGFANYNFETQNRLLDGEFYDKNKIPVIDSLKYKTKVNGRTVYGGIGIVPDVYVPFDSLEISKWYSTIGKSNIEDQIAFNYVKSNKAELLKKYDRFEIFRDKFFTPESIWKEIITKYPITNKTEEKKFKMMVDTDVKALIAKLLYNQHLYFIEIENQNNQSFIKGLDILRDSKEYNKILGNK
jgi:carboxyl-terminal processing protease